jgi:hypothetical protein
MSAKTKLPMLVMDRLLRVHLPGLETILATKEYAEAAGMNFVDVEDFADDYMAKELLAN